MTLGVTSAQALAEYVGASLNFMGRMSSAAGRMVARAANFAGDNMLLVAIVVAIIGIVLLRPRHSPR